MSRLDPPILAVITAMRLEIVSNQNTYTVGLDVFGKMIAAHETFVTDGTSETFLACVRAEMSLEFVRTGEPIGT